jgi:SAM-dependent methyltransferase
MRHATEQAEHAFDKYAERYDESLAESIAVSGEDKDYFACERSAWTARYVDRCGVVMDFGCGIGSATRFLVAHMKVARVVGVDVSVESIRIARRVNADQCATFYVLQEYHPVGDVDGVFTNGVFHHIPVQERLAALDYVYRALKPGGWFAFWENNWLSPATRYVMSRCVFDADAVPLTPRVAKTLLHSHGGFEIIRTDFLFLFPRILKWLRPLESVLRSFPLGAQYMVLCRRR